MKDAFERLNSALVGRYTIERELGAGGMAVVYLAEDVKHRRQVAVKVLNSELAETLGAERFLREIEIAAGLSHPHILPLLDSGEADGLLYYVMPYVDGESLRERLAREVELPVGEAAEILKDVADALAYAHGQGVVHRDIKPDNVMLSGRHALVMDFGVAKAVSAAAVDGSLTTAGMALGTPAYMAPEQAAADPHIDHQADIYAVGVMAYEMLAGQPPFVAGTAQQVLAAHMSQPPELVTQRRAAVPATLADVVMKCLEKRPADRWQTAEELQARFESLLMGTQAAPPQFRVGALFGVAAAGVLALIWVIMRQVGLPEWLFALAVALLLIGLPVIMLTGHHERRRASRGAEQAGGVARWFTWRNAIGGGVLAFALWGVVAAGWMVSGGVTSGQAVEAALDERRSIAVLPFANRSSEEGSEFFAEGVHDDILTQLSKISDLKVISRTSVMQYQNSQKTIREIGEELGVGTVLEGGVQRAGTRVRITAQLIDAETDEHLWADSYDQELTPANIFAIQSDVARKIADALQARLASNVARQIEKHQTESLEAYDLFNRGRYLYNNSYLAREGLERAAGLLEQAVAADSEYAPAHAALAETYLQLWNGGHLAESEALPLAQSAIDKALELDPDLPEAHAARGTLFHAQLRLEDAEREYQRAIELNPSFAFARARYGRLLTSLRRYDEGIRETQRAVELDPLSIANRTNLADAFFFAGRYDRTIAESRKIIDLQPNDSYAYYNLGYSYAMKGDLEASIAAFEKAQQYGPDDLYNTMGLAWGLARAGHHDRAIEQLRDVPEEGAMLKEIALVYGELGDFDRAFQYLDRAYLEAPGTLGGLLADQTADALREDPRFNALLVKLGLTP